MAFLICSRSGYFPIVPSRPCDQDTKRAALGIMAMIGLLVCTSTSIAGKQPKARAPSEDVELPAIPSNFSIESELVPSWGSGAIPKSAVPDNVGAFRFLVVNGCI